MNEVVEASLMLREAVFIRMRNVLENFLENPEFVVSVGGNPIVVDRFLDDARRVLKLAQEIEQSDTKRGVGIPLSAF